MSRTVYNRRIPFSSVHDLSRYLDRIDLPQRLLIRSQWNYKWDDNVVGVDLLNVVGVWWNEANQEGWFRIQIQKITHHEFQFVLISRSPDAPPLFWEELTTQVFPAFMRTIHGS